MEMSPEIVHFAMQLFVVFCIELIAMGIEEWQKEPNVPMPVSRITLPPFRSRALFAMAYLGIAMLVLAP